MTDRRWGDAKVGGRVFEAQAPRSRFKGAQFDEGRQLLHAANVNENGSPSPEIFAFAPDPAEAEKAVTPALRSHPQL